MHATIMKEKEQISDGLASIILDRLSELTILSKTYFTVQEASVFLGASQDTIRRYMYSGELAYSKPTGKRVYISRADIDKFVSKSRIPSNEEIEASASGYIANRKR